MELKKGLETVEERARYELGMVKEGKPFSCWQNDNSNVLASDSGGWHW